MVQIALFFMTLLSTYMVGKWMFHHNGLLYAGPLMLILLCHEGGHYLMCRLWRVKATPPNFIPAPFLPFGTFGALILMKQNPPSRQALFDIGAAGPLCGFIVAVPCILVGLNLSERVPVEQAEGMLRLGEPLLFKIIAWLRFGSLQGTEIVLHPLGYAGWIGLLVTALNLLPAGQLDGGHVMYAAIGRRSGLLFWPLIGGIVAMSLALHSYSYSLFVVLLAVFGRRHPAPADDSVPLDRPRKIMALVLLVVFVLCFTPVPMSVSSAGGV